MTVNDEWDRHEQREAYLGRAPFGCHVKSRGGSEHAKSDWDHAVQNHRSRVRSPSPTALAKENEYGVLNKEVASSNDILER